LAYGNNNNNKKSTPPTPTSSYEYGPPPSLNGDMTALGTTTSTGIETPISDMYSAAPISKKRRRMPARGIPDGGGLPVNGSTKIADIPREWRPAQQQRQMPEWMQHIRNRRGGDYGERSGSGAGWFAGARPRRRRTTTGRVSSEYGNQNW
jgi:hypothetical protein